MQPCRETLPGKAQEAKQVRIRDWTIVFLYLALIYASLPLMPTLWERLVNKIGNFSDHAAAFILGLSGLFIIFYLIAKRKDVSNFIWLAILASAYAFGISRLKLSIERIHFIEYGLLSIFLFRALRHNIRDKCIYLWSGIATFCLGFLDEGLQYILPNRVYEIRDVFINGIAGILGLLVIGLCLRPGLKT